MIYTQQKDDHRLHKEYDFTGKLIVLDPGHGGRDVGAIGVSGGYESYYTLHTAEYIKDHLELRGAEVILTREQDEDLLLTERSEISNLLDADAFLSIHYNSTSQAPEAAGISTYFYHNRDQKLAEFIQTQLLLHTDLNDRRIHQENLQVLRTNNQPSLLLELGFISNEEEEKVIQTEEFLNQISNGITNGLAQYFLYKE